MDGRLCQAPPCRRSALVLAVNRTDPSSLVRPRPILRQGPLRRRRLGPSPARISPARRLLHAAAARLPPCCLPLQRRRCKRPHRLTTWSTHINGSPFSASSRGSRPLRSSTGHGIQGRKATFGDPFSPSTTPGEDQDRDLLEQECFWDRQGHLKFDYVLPPRPRPTSTTTTRHVHLPPSSEPLKTASTSASTVMPDA